MAQKLEILYLLTVYRLHVQCSNKAQIMYIGSLYDCLEPYWTFFENFDFLQKYGSLNFQNAHARGKILKNPRFFKTSKSPIKSLKVLEMS